MSTGLLKPDEDEPSWRGRKPHGNWACTEGRRRQRTEMNKMRLIDLNVDKAE